MADRLLDIQLQNLREVMDALEAIPEREFENAKRAFSAAVLNAHSEVKDNVRNKLKVRTGALARAIKTMVSGQSVDNLKAMIYAAHTVGGAEVIYAPIHEYGGTIKAKKAYAGVPGGPYLNIPTGRNKTGVGVTRMQAREVFQDGGFVAKTRSGKWGVFLDGQMMFVLKKSVDIPARLGMRDAAENQIPTLLSELSELK